MIAIVGLSGAGKTTLVNLIPRFYDVTGGGILVDGTDIRDFTLGLAARPDRHRHAGNGAVRRHHRQQHRLRLARGAAAGHRGGRPGRARARVHRRSCPGRYETRIGERGQRLSGGQRQRIAIARALLKNSPILILDEATSSLDAESERLVQEALQNLMRNRTSFVIAHRLSTVRRADKIIVLEKGRVAEVGRHDELLAKPGGRVRETVLVADIRGPAGRSESTGTARQAPEVRMIKSMTGFASLTRDDDRRPSA